jgi:putative transposase
MPAAVPIRDDLSPQELRALARRERDGRVCARLHALAHALDGRSRAEAARLAGMDRQTLSDWVRRCNAQGVDGLRDRPKPGRPCGLDEGRPAALKALVLKGPDPERDGLSAWRIRDLCDLAAARCGRRYSETGMLRLVKSLDLSRQKPRPAHPGARRAEQERFKRRSPP